MSFILKIGTGLYVTADDPPAPPAHPRLPPCDLFVWSDAQNGWILQAGKHWNQTRVMIPPHDDSGCADWRRIIAAVAEVECLKRVALLWELLRRAEIGNRRARFWLTARHEYWSDLAKRWREWGAAEVPRP